MEQLTKSKSQFGFQENLSTKDVILQVVYRIHDSINTSVHADFAKSILPPTHVANEGL